MGLEDFELLAPLGKGAFAKVYKVKRKKDDKIYALKRVDIASIPPKDLEDSLNEIRILASFKHPRIIRWYETFIEHETNELCIVMEICPYGDLDQKIKRHQHRKQYIDEREIWVYAINILEGLAALHAKGVVHRDLKPANCLIDHQGCVKIADMNISKVSKGDQMKTQVGTPYFMCPEIYLRRPYTTTSDMWSLGGVLYNLAALRPPFLADNIQNLRKSIVRGSYEPLPKVYSTSIAALIDRLLQVEPADRPEAKHLLQDPLIEKHQHLLLHPLPMGQHVERAEAMLPTIKVSSDVQGAKSIILPGPAYDDSPSSMGISSPSPASPSSSKVFLLPPSSNNKQQPQVSASPSPAEEVVHPSTAIHPLQRPRKETKAQKTPPDSAIPAPAPASPPTNPPSSADSDKEGTTSSAVPSRLQNPEKAGSGGGSFINVQSKKKLSSLLPPSIITSDENGGKRVSLNLKNFPSLNLRVGATAAGGDRRREGEEEGEGEEEHVGVGGSKMMNLNFGGQGRPFSSHRQQQQEGEETEMNIGVGETTNETTSTQEKRKSIRQIFDDNILPLSEVKKLFNKAQGASSSSSSGHETTAGSEAAGTWSPTALRWPNIPLKKSPQSYSNNTEYQSLISSGSIDDGFLT